MNGGTVSGSGTFPVGSSHQISAAPNLGGRLLVGTTGIRTIRDP